MVFVGDPIVEERFPWRFAWVEVSSAPLRVEAVSVVGKMHDITSAVAAFSHAWELSSEWTDMSGGAFFACVECWGGGPEQLSCIFAHEFQNFVGEDHREEPIAEGTIVDGLQQHVTTY